MAGPRALGPGVAAFAVALIAACQSAPATAPAKPMELCHENEASRKLDPAVLGRVLADATRYATGIYGADCLVCGELFAVNDDGTQLLHITSPDFGEEMLINTSAGIWFRPNDGRVVRRGQWHSCHVRLRQRAPGE